MRERGGQAPPHSHIWLPYITPNGVRLARETWMILFYKVWLFHKKEAYK